LGPGDLSKALAGLPHRTDPRLIVGRETFDDAGVFVVSENLALVQTVDFFAPIVDDPYIFGQVAATNALSDVYAMGGEPLTAMNIVGFPSGKLPLEVLTEILRGGQDKVHEAGALIVGGHTIIDEELKYGLSVTGRADPNQLLTNAGAKVGDRLVLTKPLGTGILATAAKQDRLTAENYQRLIASMTTLNAAASRSALALGVGCATDITGFGLLGHLHKLARASGVTAEIDAAAVPYLDGARESLAAGYVSGGTRRNLDWVRPHLDMDGIGEQEALLLADAQTSGGLLVAAELPGYPVIGRLTPARRDGVTIVVR
jgi:selenide,water dikinase